MHRACFSRASPLDVLSISQYPVDYPGDYDLLLFVRFWTPEACIQEYDTACKSIKSSDWAADNLSLHGLWFVVCWFEW